MNNAPIGVMDSGVGGLTVVRQLRSLLPGEDILFFGDSKNCPYGNRTADDIVRLSMDMINDLKKSGAKCVVIACNTISAQVKTLRKMTELPLFSIVEAGASQVQRLGLSEVGLIATVSTVQSGAHQALLPDCRVQGEGSPTLAKLLDSGKLNDPETVEEIRRCAEKMKGLSHVLLGCTHYPIVKAQFESAAPGTEFLDPALAQAEEVAVWLKKNGLCNEKGGSLHIRTSGTAAPFEAVCGVLGLHIDALEAAYG